MKKEGNMKKSNKRQKRNWMVSSFAYFVVNFNKLKTGKFIYIYITN